MNSCCLLAGQSEVRKRRRPPITPRKPKPAAAAAAAAVEPSPYALSSLSSLSSAVANVAAGKPCFYCLMPATHAPETIIRNLHEKFDASSSQFLAQNNSPANHVARFVSRAGQFLCENRTVLLRARNQGYIQGAELPLKQIYSPWRRTTISPQGEYLF